MGTFLARRASRALVTLIALSMIVFGLSRATGSPVALLLPPDASREDVEALSTSLGLNKPLIVQYVQFVRNVLHGDFGKSIRWNRPVLEVFVERLPSTLQLGLSAAVLTVIIGVPLGVLAAVRRQGGVDVSIRVLASIMQGVPTFAVAVFLVLLLAVTVRVLPAGGYGGPAYMVLPVTAMMLYPLAGVIRMTRVSMIAVLDREFVLVARAKGLRTTSVIFRHVLRNAAIPIASFLGLMLVNVFLTGSVVIESIFAWPGVGQLVWSSVAARDYPMVQGGVLLLGVLVVAANVVVDFCYGLIDPRIRAPLR